MARDRDEDVLGEFHQGPQASACMARPDIKLQPVLVEALHQDQLGKPGGVHIRLCENPRSSSTGGSGWI